MDKPRWIPVLLDYLSLDPRHLMADLLDPPVLDNGLDRDRAIEPSPEGFGQVVFQGADKLRFLPRIDRTCFDCCHVFYHR